MKITFLAIAQTYKNGKSVYSVLISPTSTFPKEGTIITQYENDPRRAAIVTSIDSKFFLGIPFGETMVTLQGFALIKSGLGSTQSDLSFHVDVNMISLPSSQPSTTPSKSVPPSTLPSSNPSSFLNGLPKHVEVWGECLLFPRKKYQSIRQQSKPTVYLYFYEYSVPVPN